MSEHLLLMSIGPVQDFIAQARRTRDLWFGSHVLSEISKAAAKALATEGATLIFPALDKSSPDLEPSDAIRHGHGNRPYNVANRILAQVPGDPRQAAEAAHTAAKQRLLALGKKTLQKSDVSALLGPEGESIDDTVARALKQLDSLLEIHVLWTALDERNASEARQHLEQEMAARKSFHVFAPWSDQRGGLHKSSLDGGRETVLRQDGRDSEPWRRYQIGLREQLDGVGLLKRTGGESEQFIPLPNIGLASWLVEARKRAGRQIDEVASFCKKHDFTPVREHTRHGKAGAARKRGWIEACPFDAQLFLPERWQPYLDEYGLGTHVAELGQRVQRVLDPDPQDRSRRLPEPYPYVACLVADGDHMGKAIDRLAGESLDALRRFSAELAGFASEAQRIVEQEHHGVLVYAGGDDVLAFVCPHHALSCAQKLREAFAAIMSRAPGTTDSNDPPPTLSVGVGIGHVLQSMGRLLSLGRQAETMAKNQPRPDGGTRNALAVIFERHSGSLRRWHESWNAGPCKILEDDSLRVTPDSKRPGALSMGKIHEIAAALRRAPAHDPGGSERGGSERGWIHVLRGEVTRILARTEAGGAQRGVTPEDVNLALDNKDYEACRTEIARWVDRMLIASELMRARASSIGTGTGTGIDTAAGTVAGISDDEEDPR